MLYRFSKKTYFYVSNLIFYLTHAQSLAKATKNVSWKSGVKVEISFLYRTGSNFNPFCIEALQMLSSLPVISSSFCSSVSLAYLD